MKYSLLGSRAVRAIEILLGFEYKFADKIDIVRNVVEVLKLIISCITSRLERVAQLSTKFALYSQTKDIGSLTKEGILVVSNYKRTIDRPMKFPHILFRYGKVTVDLTNFYCWRFSL